MSIDRNSPVPLYFQLEEIIIRKIQQGVWRPGEQLPTEEEMEHEYEISRTTVRQALRDLEREGRISRQAGRGTFVSQVKVYEGTGPFTLNASEVQKIGIGLSWEVLSAALESVPEVAASHLGIPVGSQAFCLRRLRLANNAVIGTTVSYIASKFSDQIDLTFADQGGSMNYLRVTNLDQCKAERILEALPADRDVAKILGIEFREPVLVLTRMVRDYNHEPIEFFRGVYRGDRFQYHVESLPVVT